MKTSLALASRAAVSASAALAVMCLGSCAGAPADLAASEPDALGLEQPPGPFEQKFSLTDPRAPEHKVRSGCGRAHTLRAEVDLRVRNGSPPGIGYVNIESVLLPSDPEFRFSWRRCSE